MNKFKTSLWMCLSTIFIFACERKVSDQALVSLQLPNYSSVSSLSCTKCLKGVVVNVDGDGFKTITYNARHANVEEDGTELSNEVYVEVPTGDKRSFKVLTIYRDSSTKQLILHYGQATADLSAAEATVSISLNNIGVFKGGSIVGRYLSSASAGPTDTVIFSISPVAGIQMDIGEGEIINGWFNFFASEDTPMSYRLASNNQNIFTDVTLNSIMPLTAFTQQDAVARLHRPSLYYRNLGLPLWEKVNENHDIVYGFFGPGAGAVARYVCFQYVGGSPANLNAVAASNDGSSVLTYHDSDNTADLYGVSGRGSNQTPCLSSTNSTQRYNSTLISINKSQLDGLGNDTAKAMAGAFTYNSDGAGLVTKTTVISSTDFSLRSMPGIMGNIYDGAKIYSKPNANNGGYDDIKCNAKKLDNAGFTEVVGASVVVSGDNTFVSLPAVPASTDGFVACPTKNSDLNGLGAFYLGGF